jgi:hypothetical protein
MPKSRPFAYNDTGATFSGTEQVGDLSIGIPTDGFGSTGLNWYNGPDEDLGYVICRPTDTEWGIGFIRSTELTDNSFVEFVNTFFGQSFATASVAKSWLDDSGYWTSYTGISFTINSSRIDPATPGYFGGIFSDFSTTRYVLEDDPGNNINLSAAFYFNISDDDSDIISAFTASSMSTSTNDGYLWNVSWGPGSTASTIAKVGYHSGSKTMYMIAIDTSDVDYQIDNDVSGTILPGTFNFPATFTQYEPLTDKGGWC